MVPNLVPVEGPLSGTLMDSAAGVSEVPECLCKILTLCTFFWGESPWAVKTSEAVNQGKLRTTGLAPDIKEEKYTEGTYVNTIGSNACYLRCKITKGEVFSKHKKI